MITWPSPLLAQSGWLILGLILLLKVELVPAPVPRCSPLIIINKIAESSNIFSDANPYFPLPPCEYGGPGKAIQHGDYRSVFLFAEPEKVPRHNFYEFIWFLKTGAPRWLRILTGRERLVHDPKILREGYQHYTPYVRTKQIGTNKHRQPIIIDDKRLYSKKVKGKISSLLKYGPDKEPENAYGHHHARADPDYLRAKRKAPMMDTSGALIPPDPVSEPSAKPRGESTSGGRQIGPERPGHWTFPDQSSGPSGRVSSQQPFLPHA